MINVRTIALAPARGCFISKFQLLLLLCTLVFLIPLSLRSQTYTIFDPTGNPSATLGNDGDPVECGVKFKVNHDGYITGIRYLKKTGSTGVHTGHLWTTGGTMLGEATFTGETASGWQQVSFSSPITVDSGVTYIASYHSPSGDYTYTLSFFSSAVVNGPVKALANGEDGTNGVFDYSPTAVRPTSSYMSSNYWVDIVFTPAGGNSTNWLTEGNVGTTSSHFLGTTDNQPLVFKTNGSEAMKINTSGQVTVGQVTAPTGIKLAVGGNVIAEKVTVKLVSNWADYVFDENYRLPSLAELEKYIAENKHLPDVPTTRETAVNGLNLGDNQAVLLRKIEELTLHLIEVNRKAEEINKKVEELRKENEELKQKLIKTEKQ